MAVWKLLVAVAMLAGICTQNEMSEGQNPTTESNLKKTLPPVDVERCGEPVPISGNVSVRGECRAAESVVNCPCNSEQICHSANSECNNNPVLVYCCCYYLVPTPESCYGTKSKRVSLLQKLMQPDQRSSQSPKAP